PADNKRQRLLAWIMHEAELELVDVEQGDLRLATDRMALVPHIRGMGVTAVTPIFNSANYQVTERQRQSTPRRRRGTTFSIGRSQEAAASRTVGGSATPAARKARLAAGRGAERTMKRLLSCSISVSVSESRSAMICGQEPERASAAMRSSSAFFSTSARKLQNTWPRVVASSLWKIGRVESRCLAVRKVCSTVHNCLEQSMASSGLRSVLVRSTKMPSNFLSSSTLSGSIAK